MSDCSFIQRVLYVHLSGVLTALFGRYNAGATRNCCRLGARSVYTIQPRTIFCTVSPYSKPRKYGARVFSCNLSPYTLGSMTGIFYVLLRYHGGGTDTEIRVSTES